MWNGNKKSLSNKTLHFGSRRNCMSSVNLVAEIQLKVSNEWVLSIGEPCTADFAPESVFQCYKKPSLFNRRHNILRIFDVLLNISSTTSETKPDY